jgi:hypothetical protein
MIADLCFVFQKGFLQIAKRVTEDAQEASAATICSATEVNYFTVVQIQRLAMPRLATFGKTGRKL